MEDDQLNYVVCFAFPRVNKKLPIPVNIRPKLNITRPAIEDPFLGRVPCSFCSVMAVSRTFWL
jgi:hypothetical protein